MARTLTIESNASVVASFGLVVEVDDVLGGLATIAGGPVEEYPLLGGKWPVPPGELLGGEVESALENHLIAEGRRERLGMPREHHSRLRLLTYFINKKILRFFLH